MSPLALTLVLVGAFAHAAWNLLAKTAGSGAQFVWLTALAGTILYLPPAAVALAYAPGSFSPTALLFMAVSGALHAAYFVLLQRAYRNGDLSLVYPLARGTGPLLATAAAIALLGERPSAIALLGGAMIVLAVLSLAGSASGSGLSTRAGVLYALLTGTCIAAYTLWDKQAVAAQGLSPIVYYWGTMLANAAVLTPLAAARRDAVARVWREYRRQVLGVAVLSPLAYVLVLFALAIAPVYYVAPAREVSILIGAVLGAQVLSEGDTGRRLLAAGGIVLGVVALALG